MEPGVVRPACDHRPIRRHDSANRQTGRRIKHRPTDAGFVEKLVPILGRRIAGGAAILFQVAKMQMVEFRKQLRHLVALRHIRGDFLAAGMIVDMSVGIDDLHGMVSP